MKIVIDTNIVFSSILKTDGKIGDLLLNSDPIFEFYSVSYLRIELDKHKSKLQSMSRLDAYQLEESKSLVLSKVNFISESIIPYEFWVESANLVRDVDMDDIAFVALSKYLGDVKLWTGDKKLLDGIQQKGFKQGISTVEIENLRNKIEAENK